MGNLHRNARCTAFFPVRVTDGLLCRKREDKDDKGNEEEEAEEEEEEEEEAEAEAELRTRDDENGERTALCGSSLRLRFMDQCVKQLQSKPLRATDMLRHGATCGIERQPFSRNSMLLRITS